MTLTLSEIYASIAGETSWAGLPCVFVRLAGCNLSCAWCDTVYAREGGVPVSVDEVVRRVKKTGLKLVCVTGGEPLLQKDAPELTRRLLNAGLDTLVETNGSLPINAIPRKAHRIVDVKTPDSGESKSFLRDNLNYLTPTDELKFVVASLKDFDWAERFVKKNKLAGKCGLLISPAWTAKEPERRRFWRKIADLIVGSGLPFRYNIQLHKIIWGARKKGV